MSFPDYKMMQFRAMERFRLTAAQWWALTDSERDDYVAYIIRRQNDLNERLGEINPKDDPLGTVAIIHILLEMVG